MTPQNPQNSLDISKWLVVLTLLGGAGGGIGAFVGQLEPVQIIQLSIAGALVGGLSSFVLRIFGQLVNRHELRLVDLLDNAIQDVFTQLKPHARHYNRYLRRRYGTYNMAINLENAPALQLKDVFVELNMNQDRFSMNPVASVKELTTASDTIWGHLKTVQQLAIVGAPGSGKTTLLEHITLILAGNARERKLLKAPHRLPILIKLREHTKRFEALDTLKLTDLIEDSLSGIQEAERPPAIWFERKLNAGKCIVMLDGLDELGQASRPQVVTWIEQQMNVLYANCVFIITSRPGGFTNSRLKAQAVFTILPLTFLQVKTFIHNWYLQTECRRDQGQKDRHVPEMRAQEGTNHLLSVLEKRPTIAELTVNPLLLTMIVSLHYFKRATLPERRAELYREICRLFLGELEEQKGLAVQISADKKQTVLEPLAYAMLIGKDGKPHLSMSKDEVLVHCALPLALLPNITGEAFLEQLKTRTPLLVEHEIDEYEFAHKTFAEFLTAVHIKEMGLEAELLHRLDDDNWHEVICLYCSLPKVNATAIVAACISQQPLSMDRLVLAVQCAQDAQLEPETRQQLREIVEDGLDSDDAERRALSANVLLRRRQREGFRRLNENTQIDTTLVTHGEYHLFLEEMMQHGRHFYPDHWDMQTLVYPTARTPVVGISPLAARAFCEWLTEHDVIWSYRLPRQHEPIPANMVTWVDTKNGDFLIGENGGLFRAGIRIRDLLLVLVYARDLDVALARSLDHDEARDLALNIDRALTIARSALMARNEDLVLARALAHVLDRAFDRDHKLDLVRVLERMRTLNLTIALDFTSNHARAFDLTNDLVRDYNVDNSLDRIYLRVISWTIGSILYTRNAGNIDYQSADASQWLKDALGNMPGAWHRYLAALYSATTYASKDLHQQVDNISLLGQLGNRVEYRTLSEHLAEVDSLRTALNEWQARVNGAKQPDEGLLLVRERKARD